MKSLAILIGITLAGSALVALAGESTPNSKETTMTARGTFDVKTTPLPPDDSAAGPFGRLLLDKQFQQVVLFLRAGRCRGFLIALRIDLNVSHQPFLNFVVELR